MDKQFIIEKLSALIDEIKDDKTEVLLISMNIGQDNYHKLNTGEYVKVRNGGIRDININYRINN